MPGVIVPAAKEKKDALTSIMQGLQIASSVYGIKSAVDQSERAEKKDAQADEDRERQLAAEDDTKRGVLTPMQRAAMQKDFDEVPSGTAGAIPAYVRDANDVETPLFLKARGKAPAAPITKEVNGQIVQYDPATKSWSPVYGTAKGNDAKPPETKIVDGSLVQYDPKSKSWAPVYTSPRKDGGNGTEEFKKLPVDVQRTVEGLSGKNAGKIAIANQIESYLAEFKNAKTEDQKVTVGQQMLKVLNSPEGADAIGQEESKRLGSFLQYKIANFTGPGSFMGRDIPEFEKQVTSTLGAVRGAVNSNQAEIDRLMGRKPQSSTPDSALVGGTNRPPSGTALANPTDVPAGVSLEHLEEEVRKRGLDKADRPQNNRRSGGL